MRKSSVGDRSFVPSRVRQESVESQRPAFGSVPRKTLHGGIPVLKKGNAFGAVGFGNQSRNSGGFGTNRWSAGGSMGRPSYSETTFKKDTRPTTEKDFVPKCIQKLLKFLGRENYPVNLSQRMLQVPQTKDFLNIFEFLFRYFDVTFTMPLKFEEEIPKYLKMIGYPYTISKSQLLAVGTKHVWPFLLGALDWMREIIEYWKVISEQPKDSLVDLSDNELYLDYCYAAYESFLGGIDDLTPLQDELEAKMTSISNDELVGLEADCEELMKELQLLQANEGKLESLTKDEMERRRDLMKYEEYLLQLESHSQQKKAELLSLQEDCKAQASILAEILENNKKVQCQVESQAVTMTDVEEVQNQCQELEGERAKVERQEKSIDKIIWDEEIKFSNVKGKFETIAEECNDLSRLCQLIPSNAANANGKNFEIYQTYKSNTIEDLDTKKVLLSEIQEQTCIRINDLETKKHTLGVHITKLQELLKSNEERIKQMENRIQSQESDFEFKKKVVEKEFANAQELIQQKEKKIRELRMTRRELGPLEEERLRLSQKLKEVQQEEKICREQIKKELMQNLNILLERKKELEKIARKLKNKLKYTLIGLEY